jgi:hypothetical protein
MEKCLQNISLSSYQHYNIIHFRNLGTKKIRNYKKQP